jgi:hypothetical protein
VTDMPGRIAALPVSKAGYPVPFFATWIDGQPDFRVVEGRKLRAALKLGLCWVCGTPLGRTEDRVFVIGPMCAVNHISAEPPSHRDCAVYSATHCPFLSVPNMTRRDRHMPEGAENPAGFMIRRNPGVALVWVTGCRSWSKISDGNGGTLFDIGEAKEALWFARGREATRAEVLESIDSGLPILARMAEQDGPDAVATLGRMHAAALGLVPS